MLVTLDLFETHPTEKNAASGTYHFVAAVYFGYGEPAFRTLFSALRYVEQVQLFTDLVQILGFILFRVLSGNGIFEPDFHSWALLEHMILFFARQTENEHALSASAKVLVLVDFCHTAALRDGTPPEIFHLLYGLVDRKHSELVNVLLVHSHFPQAVFRQHTLAIHSCRTFQFAYLPAFNKILYVIFETSLAKEVQAWVHNLEMMLTLVLGVAY